MKTVKEASLENSKNHYIGSFSDELHKDADLDFRAGVEFAQRWISIEEDTPTQLDQDGKVNLVLTKEGSGALDIAYRTWNIGVGEEWWCVNGISRKLHNVTHWRPIEYK